MKTDITLEIEKALADYSPTELSGIRVNLFRGRHTAFEVPVSCGTHRDGLIDCVRIYEYFHNETSYFSCRLKKYREELRKGWLDSCYLKLNDYKMLPDKCNEHQCMHCSRTQLLEEHILIVCYEIKISINDFHSKNGHNFIGNQNYYVIPKDLYPKVQSKVPEGIGVVIYGNGLRVKKPSAYNELTDEEQKWMLLSLLKKR